MYLYPTYAWQRLRQSAGKSFEIFLHAITTIEFIYWNVTTRPWQMHRYFRKCDVVWNMLFNIVNTSGNLRHVWMYVTVFADGLLHVRCKCICRHGDHYSDVIMGVMASQMTSLTSVYSTVYSGADQRKHQSSASLAFVRGPVTGEFPAQMASNSRKMFPFDDVNHFPCFYSLCKYWTMTVLSLQTWARFLSIFGLGANQIYKTIHKQLTMPFVHVLPIYDKGEMSLNTTSIHHGYCERFINVLPGESEFERRTRIHQNLTTWTHLWILNTRTSDAKLWLFRCC